MRGAPRGSRLGLLPPPSVVLRAAGGISISRTDGSRRDAKRPPYRLDQNERFRPVAPDPTNDHPEQAIKSAQPGARLFAFINGKLLSKSDRFHRQPVPRDQERPHVRQFHQQNRNHQPDPNDRQPEIDAKVAASRLFGLPIWVLGGIVLAAS